MVLFGLDALKPGKAAVVIRMGVGQVLTDRLRDFGFIPGTAVRCCYRGPGNKVTALACRGSMIAIRTRDLSEILVRADG